MRGNLLAARIGLGFSLATHSTPTVLSSPACWETNTVYMPNNSWAGRSPDTGVITRASRGQPNPTSHEPLGCDIVHHQVADQEPEQD
jgi:hypothetical protein